VHFWQSNTQKIINQLEDKNKKLSDELMDIRMHSWGEDARVVSTFWKEQCRALDPVITAEKEEELRAAYKEKDKTKRVIAAPAVDQRPKRQEAPEVKPIKAEDHMKSQIEKKWDELLQYAKEHATGEGYHRGYAWLKDAFNEYLDMSDSTPGYGMGGQPGSMHNREVLAEKIRLKLGHHIGGLGLIDDSQETKLKESLSSIVQDQGQGLKRS
jgi:hypothetical protein